MNKAKQIQELFSVVNDMFYKNFLSGNSEVEDIYNISKNHLEIKLFELSLDEKEKDFIRAAMESLINKHLSIFYKVYCLKEDLVDVLMDVLDLTKEEIEELQNL